MTYKGNSKEPIKMNAKYKNACPICGCNIQKGDEIVFYPAIKGKLRAKCFGCGKVDLEVSLEKREQHERDIAADDFDQMVYGNQYSSY